MDTDTEIITVEKIIRDNFGASRLPRLGKDIGEGIRNFRKSFKELEVDHDDQT